MNDALRFDKLPSQEELDHEVQTCRHLKRHVSNDYLVKDIWNIVLSFLFGFTDHLRLSVPFEFIVSHCDVLFNPYPKYMSYFYGLDRQGTIPLGVRTKDDESWQYMNGNYPLAFADFQSSIVKIAVHEFHLYARCLIQLTFDPSQMPKPTTKWFTWDGEKSKTFYSYNEARDYSRKENVVMFHTNEGKLSFFDKHLFRSHLEILPTGDLQYTECLYIDLPSPT